MNIFRLFEIEKFRKNAPDCTIPKKLFLEACPRTLLANAWLRHASQAPKKLAPLANTAYAHGQLLRNLLEEMRS